MNSQGAVFFILAVVGVWIASLSIVVFRIYNHFKILSRNVTSENLLTILKKLVETERTNYKAINELSLNLKNFEEEAKKHIQKVGLIRFNPFKELGGDHSFVLTLLDAKDNGVIITGLHTRERTRVYVKKVKKGKVDIKLSTEEKRSLMEAQKGKL